MPTPVNIPSPCLSTQCIFTQASITYICCMSLLPDTQNCGLRIRRECPEHFSHNRLKMKPLVSDPGMHHGTCVTHVPWCMSGTLTRCGGENVPGIPGACTTPNIAYLVRGSCMERKIHNRVYVMDVKVNHTSPPTRPGSQLVHIIILTSNEAHV